MQVGIVGRTGAGKSSLVSVLLRMAEANSGTISVGSVNLTSVGLHNIRKAISVVPQKAELFSGTLRYNIDPREHASDKAIWETLEKVHFTQYLTNVEEGLQMRIERGGGNLSHGQRQQVCLARGILRNSGMIIFDEATSGVDPRFGTKAMSFDLFLLFLQFQNGQADQGSDGRALFTWHHHSDHCP